MKRYMGDFSEMYKEFAKELGRHTVEEILNKIVKSADGDLSSDYWYLLHLLIHTREALREPFTHSDEVEYERTNRRFD